MRKSNLYDLDLVHEQCREVGLKSEFENTDLLVIHLTDDIKLRFENNVTTHQFGRPSIEDDSLIDLGDDSDWHTRVQDFEFADPRGHYVSVHYLDLVAGIASGEILIAEMWNRNRLKERWPIHRDYNDEFDYLEKDDEVRVRRVFPSKQMTA